MVIKVFTSYLVFNKSATVELLLPLLGFALDLHPLANDHTERKMVLVLLDVPTIRHQAPDGTRTKTVVNDT